MYIKQTVSKYLGICSEPIFSLVISTSEVRLLMLEKQSRKYKVSYYAMESFTNREKSFTAIHRAICRIGIKTKRVCVALPNNLATVRIIQLHELLTDKEIEQEIELDFGQYIAYPFNEVNLDFEVLGTSPQYPGFKDIRLVAAKKQHIQQQIDILTKADLEPAIIEVEQFAVERALDYFIKNSPGMSNNDFIALLDIRMTALVLYVLKNNKLIYLREQPFSSDTSYTQALAEQIKLLFKMFFSLHRVANITEVFLSGYVKNIDSIDVFISDILQLKVSILNVFRNMIFASGIDQTKLVEDAPMLVECCGMALRGT